MFIVDPTAPARAREHAGFVNGSRFLQDPTPGLQLSLDIATVFSIGFTLTRRRFVDMYETVAAQHDAKNARAIARNYFEKMRSDGYIQKV